MSLLFFGEGAQDGRARRVVAQYIGQCQSSRKCLSDLAENDQGMSQRILGVLVHIWIERGVVIITDFFTLLDLMVELNSICATATERVTRIQRFHNS